MSFKSILDRIRKPPRVGLRSPARTKGLLKWCVRHRCKWAYVAVLNWGHVVSLGCAIYVISLPVANKPAWLFEIKLGLVAILAGTYFYEAMVRSIKSWNRRHANKIAG